MLRPCGRSSLSLGANTINLPRKLPTSSRFSKTGNFRRSPPYTPSDAKVASIVMCKPGVLRHRLPARDHLSPIAGFLITGEAPGNEYPLRGDASKRPGIQRLRANSRSGPTAMACPRGIRKSPRSSMRRRPTASHTNIRQAVPRYTKRLGRVRWRGRAVGSARAATSVAEQPRVLGR